MRGRTLKPIAQIAGWLCALALLARCSGQEADESLKQGPGAGGGGACVGAGCGTGGGSSGSAGAGGKPEQELESSFRSPVATSRYVWTANPEKGIEIAEQLETGTVWINEFMHISPFAPFGGHKQSGFGAEYGKEGLEEFTYSQVITVKRDNIPA